MKVLVSGYDHYGLVSSITQGFQKLESCEAHAFLHRYVPIRKLKNGPWIKRRWHGFKTHSMNRKLLKMVEKGGYEFVLCIEGGCMLPETLVKMGGIASVGLWCLDSARHLNLDREVMKSFTKIFFFEPTDSKLFPEGHYIPIGFDESIYRALGRNEIKHDLVWVGSPHEDRLPRLEEIARFARETGYDFGAYGYFCPDRKRKRQLRKNYPALFSAIRKNARIPPEEANRLYNSARIAVNLHLNDPLSQGLNPRTFEAPGAGCLLLTDYKAEMEKMFNLEREVAVFHALSEFSEKAKYYLTHEEDRRAMAERAHIKARAEHTFEARCREIFDLMRK